MPITVDAVSEADYKKWVADRKAKMPKAEPEPAQVAAAAPAAEDPNKKWTLEELKAQGEKVYAANCAACHQPTGKGLAPAFPALDGSKVVQGPKAAQIVTVLKGRPGTAMASFAQLSDSDLASVLTHTRTSWSNKSGEVTPADVKAARK